MLYQTLPIVKAKLLQSLKVKTFQERDKQADQSQPLQLCLSYIILQKIQPQIRTIFEKYFSKVRFLTISNCDLRTFQNFPYLPELMQFDASKNSLQGTFEYIVKNKSLEYIDVSDNFIKDPYRLEPLKALKNVSFCLKNNPVLSQNNNNLIKIFGAKLLKEPRPKQLTKQEIQVRGKKKIRKDKSKKEITKKDKEHSDEEKPQGNPFTMRRLRIDEVAEGNMIKIKQEKINKNEKVIKKVKCLLGKQEFQKDEEELERQILLDESNSDKDSEEVDEEEDESDEDFAAYDEYNEIEDSSSSSIIRPQ